MEQTLRHTVGIGEDASRARQRPLVVVDDLPAQPMERRRGFVRIEQLVDGAMLVHQPYDMPWVVHSVARELKADYAVHVLAIRCRQVVTVAKRHRPFDVGFGRELERQSQQRDLVPARPQGCTEIVDVPLAATVQEWGMARRHQNAHRFNLPRRPVAPTDGLESGDRRLSRHHREVLPTAGHRVQAFRNRIVSG